MKKSDARPSDSALDLEFPDWSGMEDSSQRISIAAAIALTFEYPKWFPEQ